MKWVLILPLFVLSACATAFNGMSQRLEIHTPGVEAVDCRLETPHNKFRMLAPGMVIVDRSPDLLTIACEKLGYQTAFKTLEPAIEGWWNPLTLPYDVASNGIWTYTPSTVVMKMVPLKAAAPVEKTVEELKTKPAPRTPPDGKKANKTFSGTAKK